MADRQSLPIGLVELLSNAERLLTDAKLLRKSRKYASTVGLAVLSLEEAGKFVMRMGGLDLSERPPIQGNARSHKLKQKMAASTVVASMRLTEFASICDHFGLRYRMDLVPIDEMADMPDQFIKILNSLAQISNMPGTGERMRGQYSGRDKHQTIIDLCKGDFDRLKQSAFYVDIDDRHSVVSVPSVDRELADRVLRIASQAIRALKKCARLRFGDFPPWSTKRQSPHAQQSACQ